MAILYVKRNRKKQSWTSKGTVDENTVEVFCREENDGFCDVVKIEVTIDMPYEYPLPFDVWE